LLRPSRSQAKGPAILIAVAASGVTMADPRLHDITAGIFTVLAVWIIFFCRRT